jgi:hypothetical protein
MRAPSLACVLAACLLLVAGPLGGAVHEDYAVQAAGRGVLIAYDGEGQVSNACVLPALLLTLKVLTLPETGGYGERIMYGLTEAGAVESTSLAGCAVVAPLSLRVQVAEQASGDWSSGWTFRTEGPLDVIVLEVGPYGDGRAIAVHLHHTDPAGVPILDVQGTVTDPLAGV